MEYHIWIGARLHKDPPPSPTRPYEKFVPPILNYSFATPLTIAAVKTLVNDITALSTKLPPFVQQATKGDKIWSVMNTDERNTVHETFNRRFDAMFGEDCHDSSGRLQYVRKGKLGMELVCSYLSNCDWGDGLPLAIVKIKLQRVLKQI